MASSDIHKRRDVVAAIRASLGPDDPGNGSAEGEAEACESKRLRAEQRRHVNVLKMTSPFNSGYFGAPNAMYLILQLKGCC